HCSFSSSSNGNGSKAGNYNEKDADHINSSILEAGISCSFFVKSGAEGFVIKMRDGKHLRCVQNNPQGGQVLDYPPHPAIFVSWCNITPPSCCVLLMAAVRNVQIARPTLYNVIIKMIDKMGYAVKLVRVPKREHEAYFAELYLTKLGNEVEFISFDLRPSDAINIAVRCKVPIQVNKSLAHTDGMRVIEPVKLAPLRASDGLLFSELDSGFKDVSVDNLLDINSFIILALWSPTHPCIEIKDFNILSNMFAAANEERFTDAGDCYVFWI
uniref:BFN domain-containing protein n=1 Tax=Kalanchoe fedtschenkoi TaxID=63787 RepID=A0A7N0UFR6_KALFE